MVVILKTVIVVLINETLKTRILLFSFQTELFLAEYDVFIIGNKAVRINIFKGNIHIASWPYSAYDIIMS